MQSRDQSLTCWFDLFRTFFIQCQITDSGLNNVFHLQPVA